MPDEFDVLLESEAAEAATSSVDAERGGSAPRVPASELAPPMNELIISDARKAGQTREEAIEIGRRLGLATAIERGEEGELRDERVGRAMAYAAWEWDGRPTSGLGTKVPPVPAFKGGKKK